MCIHRAPRAVLPSASNISFTDDKIQDENCTFACLSETCSVATFLPFLAIFGSPFCEILPLMHMSHCSHTASRCAWTLQDLHSKQSKAYYTNRVIVDVDQVFTTRSCQYAGCLVKASVWSGSRLLQPSHHPPQRVGFMAQACQQHSTRSRGRRAEVTLLGVHYRVDRRPPDEHSVD